MPLPNSQPNWSPKVGLNLLNSLPRLSNGALPLLNPPVSRHIGVPEPGLLAEESRGLASVLAFGSIPIQNQVVRPFSPLMGGPNPLASQPPAPTNPGHGTDLHLRDEARGPCRGSEGHLPLTFPGGAGTFQWDIPTPSTPHALASVSPRTSIQGADDAASPMDSNRSVDIAGNITERNKGSVWVPDQRAGPSGRGRVLTYKHDASHPPWSSGADYDDIVDWRSSRVISNDGTAVKFNDVCIAARALNGLDHHSDPLPWCRDGSDPVSEAAISAEYNLYALHANEVGPSQGDDERLRHLLAGPNEPKVTPGRSFERLLSARHLGVGPVSSSNPASIPTTPSTSAGLSNANKLIRKESPVTRRADLLDLPLTRTRLNENPYYPLANNEDFDEVDELDELDDVSLSVPTPKSTSVPVPKGVGEKVSLSSTRGRKPGLRLKNSSLPTSKSVVKNTPTSLVPAQQNSPDHKDSSDLENHGQETPSSSPPRKSKGKKKASSPTRFQWSSQPDELDYLFLSHLVQFQPFAVAKEQVERFHQCTLHLKNHPDTQHKFRLISTNRQTHTLRNRFKQLKVWLRRAEAASARASGSQEDDESLRTLLSELMTEEEALEKATLAAKAAKEAALTAVGRAEELRDICATRHRSGPSRAAQDVDEDEPLDDEVAPRPTNSIRALRDGLQKKLEGDETMGQIVSVTMKSSEAAQRANELTSMALEQHEKQIAITNLQRERELAQSQARLDLDAQTARETLTLRREELKAVTERKDQTDGHIDELKTSMSNVQGTLAELGSVLKTVAERLPGPNTSS